MAEKEITLLKAQREKLSEKSFDLDGWKNQTLLFLQRIFGGDHTILKMISELKYNYSSWHLRDATGNEKLEDPVKMQAREILDAAIAELENLGLPSPKKQENPVWNILEEELTGKQLKEMKDIAAEDADNRAEKLAEKLNVLKKESLAGIISRIMIS